MKSPDIMGARIGRAIASSVRPTVLVSELPLAIEHFCLKIIIRIVAFVSSGSIADLEIHHLLSRIVDQTMAVPGARLETRAHSRRELCLAFISVEDGATLQYVDEFILPGVSVTK